MTTLWGRVHSLLLLAVFSGETNRKKSSLHAVESLLVSRLARSFVAIVMTALLLVGPLSPAFGQSPAQNPPSNPAPPASAVATTGSSIAPVSSLGLAKYDFTRGVRAFPDLLKPYQQIH